MKWFNKAEKKCETCRFYFTEPERSECRRHPPAKVLVNIPGQMVIGGSAPTYLATEFPTPKPDWFCWEYKSKTGEE